MNKYAKDVYCIIVTYNPETSLINCVNKIYNQVDKVLLVDNNSTSGLDYIKECLSKEKVELIRNKTNIGIASALNIGVKKALSENYTWILTLDDDSESSETMIETMISTYFAVPKLDQKKIVALFPNYLDINAKYNKIDTSLQYTYIETEITSGSLMKSTSFENNGFYEDKLFIDYVDHEYCLRIKKNGYKIIRINNAILNHRLGNNSSITIFGKTVMFTNHSPSRRYYITRNRFYVWNKYKNSSAKYISIDKKLFLHELIKIILFEKEKILKLKNIIIGYRDYKHNVFIKHNI